MACKHIAASSQHPAEAEASHAGGHSMQPYRVPERFQTPGSPVQHISMSPNEGVPHLPTLAFAGGQVGHDSSSPSNALLERALICMPDAEPAAELDDEQLILAAAEVHFEDHAALRSHSVPCNKPLPSAIKRSLSQHTTAENQQEAHHCGASRHAGPMVEGSGVQLKME